MHIRYGSKYRLQEGAVTLAMSLILLFLITLVTLAVTRNISIEKKFSNNDVRSSLAFEAAEAGVAAAFNYALPVNNEISGGAIQLDSYTLNGDIQPSPFYNDTYYDPIADEAFRMHRGETDTGSYEVRIYDPDTNPDGNEPLDKISGTSYKIVSQGFSDDLSATRTISLIASRNQTLEQIAGNPLISRGDVIAGGRLNVINPEGDTTIWSGSDVDLSSGQGTETEIPTPFPGATDEPYPECMNTPLLCTTIDTSNKTLGPGPDVIEYDTNLTNLSTAELFEKYFGFSDVDAYIANSGEVTHNTTAGDTVLNYLTESVIVLSDPSGVVNIPSNTTIGCPQFPSNKACPDVDPKVNPNPDEWPSVASIVIVNGDLSWDGYVHISGLLFVTGDVVDGGANLDVYGAMIIGGDTTDIGNGSIDIIYHSGLLAQASLLGPSYAPPGGWRDF